MSDDLDPKLKALFNQADRPLEDDAFMRELLAGLSRVQRLRMRRRIVIAAVAVVMALVVMPAVLQQTASLVNFAGSRMESIPLPIYWAVSTLIGIWSIVRAAHLGRP